MILYFTHRSPYARKVLVTAYEKGLMDQMELVEVNLADKPASLLAHNPLGKIPALVTADGKVYYESPVICEYLDSLPSSKPALYPQEQKARIQISNQLALVDGLMDATVAYMIETFRPEALQSEALKEKHVATVHRTLAVINTHLSQIEPLSPSGIALGAALGYLEFRLGNLVHWKADFPKLAEWESQIVKRESFQETRPKL